MAGVPRTLNTQETEGSDDRSGVTDDTASGKQPAARIAWRTADGSSGFLAFNSEGWPRVELVPAGSPTGNPWLDDVVAGEYRFSLSLTEEHKPHGSQPRPNFRGAELYLELMKNCLTRMIFTEGGRPVDQSIRMDGHDWPPEAETMVGRLRLDNVQQCVTDVIRKKISGDLIETGVWRGGTTIFMRAILEAYSDPDRRVWVADSFAGLPKPDAERYPADRDIDLWRFPQLAIPVEQVQANFARYGLLDDRVRFLEGWFKDTLPVAPIDQLAVMRLDGDLYESTMDALSALYPKLSIGGYAIIDDYSDIAACRQAVDDYRAEHGIVETIHKVDWTGVYWRRES